MFEDKFSELNNKKIKEIISKFNNVIYLDYWDDTDPFARI